MKLPYKEYRCQFCKKLLFKGLLIESVVEIKCRSCQTLNTLESSQLDKFLCTVSPCPYRKN